MADLVLGMAKSAVEGTLTAARSAIEEEEKLKKRLQSNLMLISDEFVMMNSFLNAANEHGSDKMLGTMVRQVRNMALDVEDCIESAVLVDVNKCHWWRRLPLPSCLLAAASAAKPLDDAVTAVELLKTRVEAIGQRNERYRHIVGDSSSNSKATTGNTHQPQAAVADANARGILIEAREAKKKALIQPDSSWSPEDLAELINKTDHELPLQVISLWGAGGDLGVASIIKKTYDDPEICKKFSCRFRVKLMHPFNPFEFIRSLMAQFYKNCCLQQERTIDMPQWTDVMMTIKDGKQLNNEFVKAVSDKRYLVFLEDVSSTLELDDAMECLPDTNKGSCIVVHTQQLEVATLCVGQSHRVFELEQFTDDHSICVFFNEDEDNEWTIKIREAKEWLGENEIIGRGSDIENLKLMMYGKRVFSVLGTAGVGKSYIVRHVYFKEVIEQDGPFRKFGWVDVSHPFNIRDFSWRLLLDLHSGSLHHASILRIRDPIQECRQLLKNNACLIVIDGVQSKEEWDSIHDALAIESNQTEGRIIVIANEKNVAEYCSKYLWNVRHLEMDDALDLFKKKMWQTSPENLSLAGIERVKSVLHKCGGLPRVITVVAHQHPYEWLALTGDDFMPVLENHPTFSSLRDLFSWVDSFFRSCPDELKPCIFYLSIFPVNHKIRRRRLVRRWIAEGYSTNTKAVTAEEDGERSFDGLCALNVVQVPGSTNISFVTRKPCCEVNGFFREYIVSRSMEENLVFALEGHCSLNLQRTGRHLTIGRTWDRDKNVYETIDLTRMRSLTVFGKWEPYFISDKTKIIRVLDLEDALSVTDGDLEQMVKLLPRLKFLSLRGCKEVTSLPDSIGGLRQLQTLDIRHTFVVRLPLSITKLQKLQYIRAGTTVRMDDGGTSTVETLPTTVRMDYGGTSTIETLPPPTTSTLVSWLRLPEVLTRYWQRPSGSQNGGVEAPRGIGKMKALHSISVIDVSAAGGKATLEELKNLTQLHKLSVSGVNQENCKELCSAISGHPYLKSLSVWLDKDQAGCLDSIYRPPEKLQSLKLYGCVDKLPAWIKLLQNLSKLKLYMDMITQDDVHLLWNLKSLNVLCLRANNFQYGELRFMGLYFNLSVLEIDCNCMLESVTFEDCYMQQLEVLKIRCYNNVSSLKFSGLEKLSDLREVSLSGSYDDRVKQQLESLLDKHMGDSEENRRAWEIRPVLKLN